MKIKTILKITVLSMMAVASKAQTGEKSAKEIEFTAAYRERDTAKALVLGEQFLKKYPLANTDMKTDKAAYIEYYRIYLNLVVKSGKIDEKIRQYYDELPYYAVSDLYYRQVFLLEKNNLQTAQQLLDRSELLMKKLGSYKGNKPVEFGDMPEEEWMKMYDPAYFGNLLTHVHILRETGKVKEALIRSDELLSHFGYEISSFNEDYVLLLEKEGLKEKRQKALEASVNANQVTPLMVEMLKKDFLTKGGDENGFNAYMESLKSTEGKATLRKDLEASMVMKKIPGFALYDGKGNLVSSKDWKGKVVVLDFFASWCSPCKAAFPGMKMAQEKLAGEKDVLFYFVDNQERGTEYKATVMKYMKENNFPFEVLFDNEGDKGTNNQVSKLLKVSAIPRKMILDKNGMVRFDVEGYLGSPSKLADEIKEMVELIKKTP